MNLQKELQNLKFTNESLLQYSSQIDIDLLFSKLPFPTKIKKNNKWKHTCLHPLHETYQTGKTPPAVFIPHEFKSFCYSCKRKYSLLEMIQDLTSLKSKEAILTFLGIEENFNLDLDLSEWILPQKKRSRVKDFYYNKSLFEEIDKKNLIYDEDNAFFKKRQFKKDFIQNFNIYICNDNWYGGRYFVPFYYPIDNKIRLFGWEARRIYDYISPKVLFPQNSKLNNILAMGKYDLDINKPLIVVESFPDMAKIFSNYSKNVTTTFTNSFTTQGFINQKKELEKFKDIIVLADNDKGGRVLEKRFLCLAKKCNIKIARLTTAKGDPNSVSIRENIIAIKNAKNIYDYYKK